MKACGAYLNVYYMLKCWCGRCFCNDCEVSGATQRTVLFPNVRTVLKDQTQFQLEALLCVLDLPLSSMSRATGTKLSHEYSVQSSY